MIEEVIPGSLPDVPGPQGRLFYKPLLPLDPVRLLDPSERLEYQDLKVERQVRGWDDAKSRRFQHLQMLMSWEQRVNSPIPLVVADLAPAGSGPESEVERLAYRHLSRTRGQGFRVGRPKLLHDSMWRVPLRSVRHARHSAQDAGTSRPYPEREGWLTVNLATGEVTEEAAA